MNQKPQLHTSTNTDKKLAEEMRQLVLARMQATPKNLKISIGSNDYTNEELVKSVEDGNEIGQQVIDLQMEFLREMAKGSIYDEGE